MEAPVDGSRRRLPREAPEGGSVRSAVEVQMVLHERFRNAILLLLLNAIVRSVLFIRLYESFDRGDRDGIGLGLVRETDYLGS